MRLLLNKLSEIWPYTFIVFLSLPPLYAIFSTSQLLHTHDGLMHLARIAAYFKALKELQFPVRWAGDLNFGYGMPLFNYMYQLPYFLSSISLFLGFGLVVSFKIVLSLSYVLAGVFMFAFAKEFFNDTKKSLLIAVFYQYAPFRLVELLTRGSFGEVFVYTFLPLVLLGLILLFKKITYKRFIITSISTAFLILSHNSLSLVFFIVAVFFLIFFHKTKTSLFLIFLALGTGLLLSSFYWVPAIFEHKYTYGDLFMKNIYLSYFPAIQNFFIPNFFNSKGLQTQGIPVQFGLFHVIAIIFSIFVLVRKKESTHARRIVIFSFVLLVIALFFMQPISKIFWENISLLRQFQFPWRMLALVVVGTSFISFNLLSFNLLKRKLPYITLLLSVVVSTIYYWNPPLGFDKINEKYYWNYPLTTTYYGETDLIWSEGPAKSYPKKRVDVIGGKANVFNLKKKSTTYHTFSVDALTNATLVDHTQYFPGWKIYVNGKETPIQFQDPSWRGEITFQISQGKHFVEAIFKENRLHFTVNLISFLTLCALFLPIFIKLRKMA